MVITLITIFIFILLESVIYLLLKGEIWDIGIAFVMNAIAGIFLGVNYVANMYGILFFDIGVMGLVLVLYFIKVKFISKYSRDLGYLSTIFTPGLLIFYILLIVELRY